MNTLIARFSHALAATLLGAVLAHAPAHAQSAPPDVKRLKLMTTSDVQIGGPWFVAAEKDFFKAEGFESVEVMQFPAAPPAFPAFINDDIQVMSSADQPMFALAAGGQPLKTFAVYSDMTGLHGFVASGAIKTARDLEGKNIALTKGSVLEWYFRSFCKNYGCDISKMKIINMPAPEAAAALVAGSVDAAPLWQPFIDRAIAGRPDLHMLHYKNVSSMPGAEGPKRLHTAAAVAYTKEKFAQEHPRTVAALARVLDRSLKYIQQNPADASQGIARALKITPEVAAQYIAAVRFGFDFSPRSAAELQATANLLVEEKLVRRKVDFATELMDTRAYGELVQPAQRSN